MQLNSCCWVLVQCWSLLLSIVTLCCKWPGHHRHGDVGSGDHVCVCGGGGGGGLYKDRDNSVYFV